VVYAIIVLCISAFVWSEKRGPHADGWINTITGDGFGYYAYLHAVFNPSGFAYEMEKDGLHYGKYPVHPYDMLYPGPDGRLYTKYYPGVALLLSPFYLSAHVLSPLFGYDRDGFAMPYQIAVLISASFYLLLGLHFLRRTLSKIGSGTWVQMGIVLTVALGTNLFNYVWNDPVYSHVYVFFALSGFSYFMVRYLDSFEGKYLIYSGLFIGLGFFIRPTALLGLFIVPVLAGSPERLKQMFSSLRGRWQTTAWALGIASLFPLLYIGVNYLQFGDFRLWTYTGETFNFSSPELTNFLLSYRKGWMVYSPAALFPVLSGFVVLRNNRFRAFAIFLFITIVVYVLSSWWSWSYGGSFGSRPMVDFLAPFAIITAFAILEIPTNKVMRFAMATFAILCISLNLFQNWQFSRGIIDYDTMDKEKYWQVFLQTDDIFRWVTLDHEDLLVGRKVVATKEWHNNFDDVQDWKGDFNLVTWPDASEDARFGKSLLADKDHRFGATLNLEPVSLKSEEYNIVAEVRLKCKLASGFCDSKVVLSLEGTDGQHWQARKLIDKCRTKNTWCEVKFHFTLPEIEDNDESLLLYILHDGRKDVWVDDISLTLNYLEPKSDDDQ
jgi:hypothetical protein